MSPVLLITTLTIAVLMVAGLYRAWRIRGVFNRLLAINYVTVNGVLILALVGFLLDHAAFILDIAIGYALFAFLLPVSVGRFFQQPQNRPRGDDEEPPP